MNPRGYFVTIAAMLVLVTILLLVRDYRPDPLPPVFAMPTQLPYLTAAPQFTAPAVVDVRLPATFTVTPVLPNVTTPPPTMQPCPPVNPQRLCLPVEPTKTPAPTWTPIICVTAEPPAPTPFDVRPCYWPSAVPTVPPTATPRDVPTSAPQLPSMEGR